MEIPLFSSFLETTICIRILYILFRKYSTCQDKKKSCTVTFGDVDWEVTGNALRGKRVLRGTCVVSTLTPVLVASSRDLFATGTFSYWNLLRRLVRCA